MSFSNLSSNALSIIGQFFVNALNDDASKILSLTEGCFCNPLDTYKFSKEQQKFDVYKELYEYFENKLNEARKMRNESLTELSVLSQEIGLYE